MRRGVIDAVVATRDSRELVVECLDRLRSPLLERVIVVDNGSQDGTAAAVREARPEVLVVRLEDSEGLSHAYNRGAEAGSAELVLFLNDDVFATDESISELDRALALRPDAVAAAGRLVVPDLEELTTRLRTLRGALERGTRRTLERERERTERLHTGLERGARQTLARERDRADRLHERLARAPRLALERKRASIEQTAGRLRALSPRATLARGYAIVRTGEGLIRSSTQVHAGTRVDVELAEGGFGARVEDTK